MNGSISLKVPQSSKRSIRSRAVNFPLALCFLILSSPPPSSAFARILRSSRILGSSVVINYLDPQYSFYMSDKPVMDSIRPIGKTASSFLTICRKKTDGRPSVCRQFCLLAFYEYELSLWFTNVFCPVFGDDHIFFECHITIIWH